MAYTQLGRIRPMHKGSWSSSKAYITLDMVRNGNVSYIANKDVPAGTSLSNGEYWSVVLDVSDVVASANNAINAAVTNANNAAARANQATDNANVVVDLVDGKVNAIENTVEGKLVQIDNADEGSFLKPVLRFDPIQSGSGNPYPAGCGAQLFDVHSTTSTIPVISDDDWVTVELDNTNGTSTAYASLYTPVSNRLVEGKQYVVVTEIKELTGAYLIAVGTTTTTNKAQFAEGASYETAGTKVKVITALDDFSDCKTMLRTNLCAYAGQIGKCVFRISVLEDTTITADTFEYMPHANIRAIGDRTTAGVIRCGKNLVSYDYPTTERLGVVITKNENGYYTINGTATSSGVCSLLYMSLPAGTYTLSVEEASGSCSTFGHTAGQLIFADENKVAISVNQNNSQASYTLNERANIRVRLFINGGTTYNNWKVRISLAAGPLPAHEPYLGDTFNLNFGQTVYGGTLDWTKGEMVVDRAIHTMDGVTSGAKLTATSGSRPNFYYAAKGISDALWPSTNDIVPDIVSSHFKVEAWNEMIYHTTYDEISMLNSGCIGFAYNGTIDEANAWLIAQYAAGTPVQIAYKLATPIIIQLAPQQITALAGMNTVYSDADEMVVNYHLAMQTMLDEIEYKANALVASDSGDPISIYPDEGSVIKPVLMFEPVQEGSGDPSPENIRSFIGRTGAELVRCGKNLLNPDLLVLNRAIDSNTGKVYTLESGNYYATEEYIPIVSGATIAISQKVTLAFYDSDKQFINAGVWTSVIAPDNAAYFRVDVHKDYKDIAQLELGSTVTPFEPYQGDTFTLNF
ncbi:MAG: hypothetical protein J6R18_08115, partial [Kiritimatiellae bacterium]|nr:hypothetical protein [Kiritimatiellia bacterium]